MKKFVFPFLLLGAAAGALSGCREQARIPEPATEDMPLILPDINPAKNVFTFTPSRASESTNPTRPVFEFTVNPTQVDGVKLEVVEVYKTFARGGTTFGPRVKVKDLTSFPATVSINSQDALTDLYLTNNPPPVTVPATPPPIPIKATTPTGNNRILSGDAVVFTFEYVVNGGRRIVLTPLTTVAGVTGVISGNRTAAPFAAIATFK